MNRCLPLLFLCFACGSDYNVALEKDPERPGPTDETGFTEETGTPDPEDTDDPVIDSGNTTSEGDKPIAVCSVSPNPVHPPFESARWDGTDSYDPEGGTITDYTWTLASRPSGSSVGMPSCSGPTCGSFTPDLAGTYVGRLVVKTSDGRTSNATECELTAVPTEDLWIEMFWVHNQDDMDLHLLAPGGTINDSFTNTDCYFANCTSGSWFKPDWGVVGDTSDDPTLDLDDIPGVGPENINISSPASGTYTVAVVDYTGSTPDYSGSNDVTVNIYIGGALVWTDTRAMSGETTEYFAKISWPARTVTSM
jgi:hypothetical protein